MKKSGLTIVGEYRRGWAIEVTRADGSTFLATGGDWGVLPFVAINRKWAVRLKRDLIEAGTRARVVPVEFIDPWRVPER